MGFLKSNSDINDDYNSKSRAIAIIDTSAIHMILSFQKKKNYHDENSLVNIQPNIIGFLRK